MVALAGTAFAQPAPCQLDDAARAYDAADFDQAQRLIAADAGRPSLDRRTDPGLRPSRQALAGTRRRRGRPAGGGGAARRHAGLHAEARRSATLRPDGRTIEARARRDHHQLGLEDEREPAGGAGDGHRDDGGAESGGAAISISRRRCTTCPGSTSRGARLQLLQFYQRGYRSDTTNRTLFLVDGVEQNDLHSYTARISRQFPLTNIDRVEVVYGPASTMYGANAFLGVINVITKDPDDVIKEGKSIGADVQVGGGAWNTRFLDGTVAGRYRGATLSLTGRIYKSDEWDLSRYANWDYDPAVYSAQSVEEIRDDRYCSVRVSDSFSRILFQDLRFVDPFNPISLDAKLLQAPFNGRPVAYSELTDDWMMSGRLKLNNFTVGVQAWQRKEGATGEGTDMEVPGALNGNVWIPRETSFFVRYAAPLSGSVSFSYFGQAKIHSVATGSSVFSVNSYLNGPFDPFDLFANFDATKEDGVPALLDSGPGRPVLEPDSQRAESRLSPREHAERRRRPRPAERINSSRLREGHRLHSVPAPLFGFQRRSIGQRRDGQRGQLAGDRSNRPIAGLRSTHRRSLGPVHTDRSPRLPSRHRRTISRSRSIGVFAQASYKPRPTIKLVAGWRVDNNHIDQGSGFGTVVTPRLGMVYSPRGFVTKAIYSEAFEDPSNLEKFTTLPGVLDLPDDRFNRSGHETSS